MLASHLAQQFYSRRQQGRWRAQCEVGKLHLLTLSVRAGKAESVAKTINEAGGKAVAVPGDMLDAKYIDELVKKAAKFGEGKIHIIVNNAGFTWDGVIHKMTDKQWDTIIALHNTAPFKLVRAAAPYFRVKDGEPRNIINISSTSGVNGNACVICIVKNRKRC